MLKLLIPNKKIILTQSLVYLNITVFLVMTFAGVNPMQPTTQDLINWGGNSMMATLSGQPWRLLTSIFVHGGLIHLAVNMFSLLMMGVFIEVSLGKVRYFIVYLFCGISASAASLTFNDATVSIGASGAIFGLVGFLLLLLLSKKILLPSGSNSGAIKQIFIVIAINLAIGFSVPMIDNAAHIGGLVAGLVAALVFIPQFLNKSSTNVLILIFASLTTIIFAQKLIPNRGLQYAKYEKLITSLAKNEKNTYLPNLSNQFRISDLGKYKKIIIDKIDNKCIKLWQQNLKQLQSFSPIPKRIKSHYKKVLQISSLRLKQCRVTKEYFLTEDVNKRIEVLSLENKVIQLGK